ncbi:TetR/AcrR family transcriptional regulator [Microbacterium sp. bgisy189]|uniref:TetR/AcrR family transcriptional regulator n=1 Tax=Microbacterium sp. bgisy189 TaxID=3413798 RepID=UPI003EC0184C
MAPTSAPGDDAARRRGRPGYDRQQILDLAVQLFITQGYDATSVADLAARFGLTKSALYHHFRSKEELLGVALDQALGALEGVLDEPAATTGTAADRLAFVIRSAVEVLIAHLPAVTLLLRVHGNSDVERDALARRRSFDQRVAGLTREAQAEGAIRPDVDAAVATRLIFGMVNSITEWYRSERGDDPGILADDVLRIALDGLRVPGA